MGKCKDCQNPGCPKCGTTHPMSECIKESKMSETVRYTGKLRPVEEYEGDTLESICKRILKQHELISKDGKLNKWWDSYSEMLSCELDEQYVIADDSVYEIVDKQREQTEYDIFNARRNYDGSIDYEVMYYNGGCSFSEAIDTAVRKLEVEEERC